MATKITNGNNGSCITGSVDKRIDIAPDGRIWALIATAGSNGQAKFYHSLNGGNTWTYASKVFNAGPGGSLTTAGISSDLDLGQNNGRPSFFIDADGYAHVAWVQWDLDPQVIMYARGIPVGTATDARGWSWTKMKISPASGRTDTVADVVAFRLGTGWKAFVSYALGGSGGVQVAQINVSRTQGLHLDATTMGPSTGLTADQVGTLEFDHTGDGKTPTATPHLYLATGVRTSTTSLRLNKAVYSGGTWTWQTAVVAASAIMPDATLCTVYDGSVLMVAWSSASATIKVSEWDGTGAAVTRNPPAAPGGVGQILGLSLSHDPTTDDIFLAAYDVTDGDIRWTRFDRGTLTWDAWAVAHVRIASNQNGKVQLVRHPSRDSVDMLFADGADSTWEIFSQQLAPLIRPPGSPTLVYPPAGGNLDLAAGATFTWQYNPVSPGDSQQAWAFVRTFGVTTEYWNATAQSWSSTIIWNTTVPANPTSVSFPAGKWVTGTTYTWNVMTRSATGADSPLGTARSVQATTAPVVDVTDPSAIVYNESAPMVIWTYTNLSAQRDYQIKIFVEDFDIDPDATVPVWNSGVISSSIARSARIGVPLTDGVTYRAYVRSTSAQGISSAWDYSQFSISLTPPSGPLIEAIDEVDYVSGVPRVRLDLLGQSNFLTAAQATGASGWDNVENTGGLAHQALDNDAQLYEGLKVTTTGAGTAQIITELGDPPLAPFGETQPDGPLHFPVVSGIPYTALVQVRTDTQTGRQARVRIWWYDANDTTGNLISESVGDLINITPVSYNQVHVTDYAPVAAVLGRMVIEFVGASASEVFYTAFQSFHPGRSQVTQPGGMSNTETFRVQRSDDAGASWKEIVHRVKPTLAQQASIQDREMPFGVDVSYRAFTDVDAGLGAIQSSDLSLVATLALDAERWAVRDLSTPDNELYAYVVDHKRSDDEQSSVHHPAGREYPIVDTEGPQAATGTLTIFVYAADIARAVEVLRSTAVFVIQSPAGTVFYARLTRRTYNIEQNRHRQIDVPYIEVEP